MKNCGSVFKMRIRILALDGRSAKLAVACQVAPFLCRLRRTAIIRDTITVETGKKCAARKFLDRIMQNKKFVQSFFIPLPQIKSISFGVLSPSQTLDFPYIYEGPEIFTPYISLR